MAKMMTLTQFKKIAGDFQFVIGKGRAFAPTAAGNLYLSDRYNPKKEGWVIEANDIPNRPELDGTLWLSNADVSLYDITQHKPEAAKAAPKKAAAKKD